MTLLLFRCAHSPEELNEVFEKLFNRCDIIFYEQAASDIYLELKQLLYDLSFNGILYFPKMKSCFDEYHEKFNSFIRSSEKRIELEKSPIDLETLERIESLSKNSIEDFINGRFELAYDKLSEYVLQLSKAVESRDNSIFEQLVKIQEGDETKTSLVPMGPAHTVYLKIKEAGLETENHFPYKPYLFQTISESIRKRIIFNESPSPNLLVKYFPESFILTYLTTLGNPFRNALEESKKFLTKMNYDEIKNLSEYLGRRPEYREFYVEASILWARKNGFEI